MNARIPSPTLPAGARTTTVFTSGNSQAVRLPKDFRFSGKTVEISRRGDEIVLREKPLLVRDVIGKLRPIDGLPDDIDDYPATAAPNMDGIS